MSTNDSIAFLTSWAADIRASSGVSVDADTLEKAASTIADLEAENSRLRGALVIIAHTFTEDSHGGTKYMSPDWHQDVAKSALTLKEQSNDNL